MYSRLKSAKTFASAEGAGGAPGGKKAASSGPEESAVAVASTAASGVPSEREDVDSMRGPVAGCTGNGDGIAAVERLVLGLAVSLFSSGISLSTKNKNHNNYF